MTSSVEEPHGLLLMVHRSVYDAPAVPLNAEVGLEAFPKEPPVPLTILQEPVPVDGKFAAKETVVSPQVEVPF